MKTMKLIPILTKFSVISSVALLAACGGGSSSGNGGALEDFAAISTAASSQAAAFIDGNGAPIAGATRAADNVLAGQSSGTYDGYISGATTEGAFVAELELTVDFASESLTSTASDFRFDDDTILTGSVTGSGDINTDTFGGVLPQAALTLGGSLSDGTSTLATDLALDGDFYQSGSDAAGAVAGTVEGNIGSSVVSNGLFAAEQ